MLRARRRAVNPSVADLCTVVPYRQALTLHGEIGHDYWVRDTLEERQAKEDLPMLDEHGKKGFVTGEPDQELEN